MMMEVMDCDLHRVIQSKQPLSEKHFKCFIKQILEGIKAMHAIGVFHRDLKPGNILVSKDCQLRITDFGLARFMDESTRSGDNQLNPMTEYVVTRWYRCPELLLSPNRPYNEAIDLWSIGCILAELLRRKPLFPGKSHANQVQMIFEVLGYSNVRDLGFPVSAEASAFLDKRCKYRRQPLEKIVPDASREAIELLESLLELNPDARPTAVDALAFPFLVGAEVLHDYSKNYLTRPSREFFDFEHEKYTALELKAMIELEVRLDAAYAYQYERLNQRTGSNSTSSSSHSSPEHSGAVRSPEVHSYSNDSSRENSARPSSQQQTALRGGSGDNQRRMSDHNMNAAADELEQGPASQLATQLRNSKIEKSKDNPFRSQPPPQQQHQQAPPQAQMPSYRPHSSDAGIVGSSAHNDLAASAAASKNMLRSGSVVHNDNSDATSDIANGGNILQAVRVADSGNGATSRSRRSAPKTPSPQKMDAILQKDLNNKKRFVLEDMQRQREIDAKSYPGANGNGNGNGTAVAAVDGTKKTSRWTFPSNAPAAAAPAAAVQGQYNSAYSQQQQQQAAADAKRSSGGGSRMSGVPFPSLAKISNFGSRLSGSGGVAAGGNNSSRGGASGRDAGNVSSSASVGSAPQQPAKAVPMRASQSIMHGGSNIINSDNHDHMYH